VAEHVALYDALFARPPVSDREPGDQ
jgi:hypothetical protein